MGDTEAASKYMNFSGNGSI